MVLRRSAYLTLIVVVAALVGGCQAAAPSPTAAASATAAATSEPTASEPDSPHRIGIRVVGGVGEFYDRLTGETFVPRGNNYIRLGSQQSLSGGTMVYHSTFNVGAYDPLAAEQALSRMQDEGYNVVRVFLNGGCRETCIGDAAGRLSAAYVASVAEFLQRASAHEIFVILTTDAEPGTAAHYIDLLDTDWSASFGGTNSSHLRRGGILVGRAFWQDLIAALREQNAPLEAIFAYELRNELFFETNAPPLSLSSGSVVAGSGRTYDMASDEDRQRMMDEGLVAWIDQIRGAILEVDPTALVTVGFFPPDSPNPWPSAPRYIRTEAAIWESSVDFLDFHPYPGGYGLGELVENFGMEGLLLRPVIMGEFGSARSTYASASAAARALHDWQVDSCQYGFDGWLLWTWDSDEQGDFYNGLADGGLINEVLSPRTRPDPCRPGDFPFFETNLALGATARASRSLPGNPASNSINGVTSDWWGAGDFATQWIEIDLGEPVTIAQIRLVVSQSPAGRTRHTLLGGAVAGELAELQVFDGSTSDGQVLEYHPATALEGVRYVRVVTTVSPSWIGWREIEILAP